MEKSIVDIIRDQRDFHGRPMQTFDIGGKKIKTNYGAWQEAMWNGNDIPEKYCFPKGQNRGLRFGESKEEALAEAIAAGYTEIRFVETSTCVRGYHHVYMWMH